jgi:hypothetical protein
VFERVQNARLGGFIYQTKTVNLHWSTIYLFTKPTRLACAFCVLPTQAAVLAFWHS